MNHLFEELAPPQGGLRKLREKLDRQERKAGAVAFRAAALACGSMAVSLAVVGLAYWMRGREALSDYGVFQEFMDPGPLAEEVRLLPQEGRQLTLVALDSGNPAVKLFWIEEANPVSE